MKRIITTSDKVIHLSEVITQHFPKELAIFSSSEDEEYFLVETFQKFLLVDKSTHIVFENNIITDTNFEKTILNLIANGYKVYLKD